MTAYFESVVYQLEAGQIQHGRANLTYKERVAMAMLEAAEISRTD